MYTCHLNDKMKRIACFFFVMLTITVSGCVQASEKILVERLENKDIAFILARVKVDVDRRLSDFYFRFLSVREDGECDGNPSTCPKTNSYMVVATIDEDPDIAVYKLEASHSWKIDHIDEIESYDEFQKQLIIHLERTVPSDNLDIGWWKIEKIKIKINPWEFSVLNRRNQLGADQAN